MRKFATAVVSAAAGLGIVLAVHGSRSPIASASRQHHASHAATSSASSSHKPSSQKPLRNGVALGSSEQYGYGVLAVKVTASAGRIADLSTVGLRTAEPYSQSLAQQVLPVLRSEVLQAQSTNVATISGATYTSEAYLYSLQSALDRLRS
ncbi:MAG: FMN-binding protein [Acidimicrobiales bacterium]